MSASDNEAPLNQPFRNSGRRIRTWNRGDIISLSAKRPETTKDISYRSGWRTPRKS